tara:strand:+ start:18407 stop:18880 length:474 start_codon:yes stop_codon:yes gene_type:complete
MSELKQTIIMTTETDMHHLAACLAAGLQPGTVITLSGQLGAGKTTLVRGLLQALGHEGAVKSPTFTLVEPYEIALGAFYHFDLYRVHDSEELEFMGVRDYFTPASVCCIEWPENAQGRLQAADLHCNIIVQGTERVVTLTARTDAGEQLLQQTREME